MPDIYMDMSDTDVGMFYPGRKYSYQLLPQNYLLYPKVNKETRATSCAYSLWNIGNSDS